MSLPQPPWRDKLPVVNGYAEMPRAWIKWFTDLAVQVGTTVTVTWASISKSGSSLTDIETRNHADLQNLNTADYAHLYLADRDSLVSGSDTTLHQHTRYMDVATYDTDADGIVDSAENIVVHVRNATGVSIPKGSAVYISGATGQMPTVTLAQANAEATSSKTLGLLNADLANNENGYAIVTGRLAQVDTSAFTDGDTLWLSATTAGGLTNVVPTDPNHAVFVGYCAYSQNNNGIIVINIQNGYELNELHNVVASAPSDKDAILYNSGTALWESRAITGTDVKLEANTGLTHTVQDMHTLGHSAGIVTTADFDALVVASATAGSVDVAAFGAYFRTSATPIATIKYYSVSGSTVAIPSNTSRYIIADYNAGTPTVSASATDTSNGYTTFTIAYVENISGVVHMVVPLQDRFNDHSKNIIRRIWEANGVERVSGAILSQPTNLQVAVTSGAFWAKSSRFTSLAFDSSTATGSNGGTFFTYYYTGAAWVETASLTTLPVTDYNNIASGLVAMIANRWSYYDVYLGVNDGDVRILYGQAQYLTLAEASLAPLSSILPAQIGAISYRFIGRFVFQKNAASFDTVLTAFESELALAGISSHNDLAGLQGGTATEYYHLTSAEYAALGPDFVDSTFRVSNSVDPTKKFAVSLSGNTTAAVSTIVFRSAAASSFTLPIQTSYALGTLAEGATTEILVGGGANTLPVWTTATGTGAPARAVSPVFTTPNIGSATGDISGSSGSCTGNSNTATTLSTPRAIYGNNFDGSAALTQVIASIYGGTGNGFTKFTGPATTEKTFTLPDLSATLLYSGGALGTPSSGTLTSCTGLPVSTGISGLGTSVATALAVNVGTAGSVVVNGGALGTPSSGDLANCTFPTLNQNTTGTASNVTGVVAILNGGTGQTTQQTAIDALTAVSGATNEHVLTKDTATGNAVWKASSGISLATARAVVTLRI